VYGLSPGRSAWRDTLDAKTFGGDVASVLSSVFVPGGVSQPLSATLGEAGDLAIHGFSPVMLTGEALNEFGHRNIVDVLENYVPMVRDINNYFQDSADTFYSVTSGRGTPGYQLQQYANELQLSKSELEPVAAALGYTSVDGLLNSDRHGLLFKPQIDQRRNELADQFPQGAEMYREFTDYSSLQKKILYDITNKVDRTSAEDAILSLAQTEKGWTRLRDTLNIPEAAFHSMVQSDMRRKGERYVGDNRFAALWDKLFAYQYGPLRRTP
jgi:hypothetical protein